MEALTSFFFFFFNISTNSRNYWILAAKIGMDCSITIRYLYKPEDSHYPLQQLGEAHLLSGAFFIFEGFNHPSSTFVKSV